MILFGGVCRRELAHADAVRAWVARLDRPAAVGRLRVHDKARKVGLVLLGAWQVEVLVF